MRREGCSECSQGLGDLLQWVEVEVEVEVGRLGLLVLGAEVPPIATAAAAGQVLRSLQRLRRLLLLQCPQSTLLLL